MSNVCIAGLQWGDEGKGKFVDYFTDGAEVVVRFQGGNNAGHTIVHKGISYKLSLLPSGILHKGKISFIASGVVVDLESLKAEIERNRNLGIEVSPENLKVADNVTVILPLYKKLDLLTENIKGDKKIGTTGRGISLAYQDTVGRRAIRMCDLFEEEVWMERLSQIIDFYSPFILKYEPSFNIEECRQENINYIKNNQDFIKPYLVLPTFLSGYKNKNILFEGAQGAMLDCNYGTYPYVTSSNTLPTASFIGCGFGGRMDKIFGVAKAYCTRVGFGPFPSEDFTSEGELLQTKGAEFGTVTGRIRRCGFLDLVALKHIITLSGTTDIILTKIDVMDDFEKIKVCVGYEIEGEVINFLPSSQVKQDIAKPIYKEFAGWKGGYSFKNFESLPENLKTYIKFIEEYTLIPVSVLSFGAEREETLNLKNVW